jgi:sulfite exporter TauE/SafE/copper chaperone CopZ
MAETIEKLKVNGMHCVNCERAIEKALRKIDGVGDITANFNGGWVLAEYDSGKTDIEKIKTAINGIGYTVIEKKAVQTETNGKLTPIINFVCVLCIIFGTYYLLNALGIFSLFSYFQISAVGIEGTSMIMLFIIGLLTSVHCVVMCGGINISQNINRNCQNCSNKFNSPVLYNLGRLISYTVIGTVIGAIGMAITFNDTVRGVITITAGMLIVIFGLVLLGVMSLLRYLLPRMPKMFGTKIEKIKVKKYSPFVVGLLNGFMPCGPLQTMQIYALSTGSWFLGGLSMFIFALGTIPLMFAVGLCSGILTKKFSDIAVRVGAVLMIIMGLYMFSGGLSLTGVEDRGTADIIYMVFVAVLVVLGCLFYNNALLLKRIFSKRSGK